jgi:ferredoxin
VAGEEKALVQAISSLDGNGILVDGDFLWPEGEVDIPVRRSDARRDVDHVCDAEIEAMVQYCRPQCREVCPVDCIPVVPAHVESRETLVLKYEGLMAKAKAA